MRKRVGGSGNKGEFYGVIPKESNGFFFLLILSAINDLKTMQQYSFKEAKDFGIIIRRCLNRSRLPSGRAGPGGLGGGRVLDVL